jgi:hypothetical protein
MRAWVVLDTFPKSAHVSCAWCKGSQSVLGVVGEAEAAAGYPCCCCCGKHVQGTMVVGAKACSACCGDGCVVMRAYLLCKSAQQALHGAATAEVGGFFPGQEAVLIGGIHFANQRRITVATTGAIVAEGHSWVCRGASSVGTGRETVYSSSS